MFVLAVLFVGTLYLLVLCNCVLMTFLMEIKINEYIQKVKEEEEGR